MRGGSIEVYTSHWRSPLLADVDAVIVSISRGQPRRRLPFRYRKLSQLAPSDEAWGASDWEAFEAAYKRQLEELGATAILAEIRRISVGRAAVLLCWERLDSSDPSERCHRTQLARYLEREAGIVVPELQPGNRPQRPEAPQMRLF